MSKDAMKAAVETLPDLLEALDNAIHALEWHYTNTSSITDIPRKRDAKALRGLKRVRAALEGGEEPSAREEAKRARPPSDEEPWVVADNSGVRVTFRDEGTAWRWRDNYTDRLDSPTVTYEPASPIAADTLRDAEAEFEVHCDGEYAASACGPRDRAWAEIMRYAAQYAQDGPITLYEVTRKELALHPKESFK